MYHQCYLYPRIFRILLSVLPFLYEMSYGNEMRKETFRN